MTERACTDAEIARYILAENEGRAPIARGDVYRKLVRNSLRRVVLDAMPEATGILGAPAAAALVDQFLAARGPETSFYRDVPEAFVDWVREVEHPLADLIHWEWLELVAGRCPIDLDRLDAAPAGTVCPNPTMQLGVYTRPVDEMDEDLPDPPLFPSPMAYLVWRRPHSDEVAFHRVGLLIGRALALAATQPMTVRDLVARLAAEVPQLSPPEIEVGLEAALSELRAREGVLDIADSVQ